MAYLKPQSPIKDKDGDYIYPLTTVDQVVMPDGRRLNAVLSDMDNDDNDAVVDYIVPTPTTDDNGKFLKVVNGSPTWAAIPNAEEAAF